MNTKRLLLLGVLIAAIAAFFIFDLKQIFSVEYFQAQRMRIDTLHAQHPVATAAVYFAIYVVIAALSVPGAAAMTLIGGALFGVALGHGPGVICCQHRRHAGVPDLALAAGRLGAAPLRRSPARLQRGLRSRRRLLSGVTPAGGRVPVLAGQHPDGTDEDQDTHVLLGQPAGDAARHACLRVRRQQARRISHQFRDWWLH